MIIIIIIIVIIVIVLINSATVLLTFCLPLHHPRMKLSEKGAGVILAGSSEFKQSCTDTAFQSVAKVTDKNTLCLLRDTFVCSGREYLVSCGHIRAPRFWHRNVYPWHFWVCLWLIFMCNIIMFNRWAPGSWSSGRLPNCDALSVFFKSCYFRPGELYWFTNKCITHYDDWYMCGFASRVSLFLFIIEMKIYFRKWNVWPVGLLVSGQRIGCKCMFSINDFMYFILTRYWWESARHADLVCWVAVKKSQS